MTGGDLIWDRSTLDRFIANPDQVVPGHTMRPYGGVASPEERASIIDYLEKALGKIAVVVRVLDPVRPHVDAAAPTG